MAQAPDRLPLVTALDFLGRADEFWLAYRDLPKRAPPGWPRYFLLCHSIELALKAYLALRGVSVRDLRDTKLRHDIKALLTDEQKAQYDKLMPAGGRRGGGF